MGMKGSFPFAHKDIKNHLFCHIDINTALLFGQRIAYYSPKMVKQFNCGLHFSQVKVAHIGR